MDVYMVRIKSAQRMYMFQAHIEIGYQKKASKQREAVGKQICRHRGIISACAG